MLVALQGLLDGLAELADGLTVERLRRPLAELVDIVETDLGLSPDFLAAQVDALIADVIARLESEAAGEDAASRANRVRVARALRRLRARVAEELVIPALDPTALAGALLEFVEGLGVDSFAKRVACLARTLGDAVEIGTDVLAAVPFTGFGAGSVGAAAAGATGDRFCWYASWLMATKGRPWHYNFLVLLPNDEVWVEGGSKVVLRRRLRDDVTLAEGTDDWRQALIFKPGTATVDLQELGLTGHYTFGRRPAEQLESWAYGTAVAVEALAGICHLISLEDGDFFEDSLNALYDLFLATDRLRTQNPTPWWLDTLLVRTFGTLLASLEGMHTRATPWNWFTMWLTLAGPDLGEVVTFRLILGGVRDFVLSLLTLRNYVAPADLRSEHVRRPENRIEVDGVSVLPAALFNKLHVMLYSRDDYCYPFKSGDHFATSVLFWQLLVGIPFGLLGGFVGALSAEKLLSGADDLAPLAGKMGRSVLSNWIGFWISLYSDKEGKTSDGTYNPPNGPDFAGYPPASSSPYKLPYTKGRSCYVGQANLGLWSHNPLSRNRVYAVDFSLDEGEPVLAARPGTVVDFFDWVPDDTNPAQPGTGLPTGVTAVPGMTTVTRRNIIVVRHDVDDAGVLLAGPDAVHDRGPAGAVGVTYAIYQHGRQGSVRRAFAAKLGIPFATIQPSDILDVGAPVTVRQGEQVMESGDTGLSFHNHLHMHVQLEAGPGGTPVRGMQRNDAFTVPFVFREVSHFLETDGVPAHFNVYFSDNGP